MERRLRIDITDNCNLRCLSCQIYPAIPKQKITCLDFELFKRQTQGQLNDWDVIQLGNTAEPTIHPDFDHYLTYLQSEFDGVINLVTNGTRLMNYADRLNEKPCRINISLDNVDPEGYAKIRRGSKLENVIRGIDMLDLDVVKVDASFYTYALQH